MIMIKLYLKLGTKQEKGIGLKTIISKKMPERLPNNSSCTRHNWKKLLNEIKQIVYWLYQSK